MRSGRRPGQLPARGSSLLGHHGLEEALLLDVVRSSVPAILPKLRELLEELGI